MTLQFRRGPSAQAPSTAALGEPIYVTDTGILYIGSESGLQKIGPVTAADLEGLNYTPVESIDVVPGLTAVLAGKSDVGHTHSYSDLTGTPPAGATALTDLTDFPSGSPNSGEVLKWNGSQWTFAADLTGDAGAGGDATTLDGQAPAYYLNREYHTGTQPTSTISGFDAAAAAAAPVQTVAGKTGSVTLTKADVGLGDVDNTSDAAKPVSALMQDELDLKADISSLAQVATSGSYTHLIDKPTIPSSFTDLLPDPSDTQSSATIVWSVANQQWEISQDGAPPVVDGFEFRGFFSAASNPFGSPASPFTAVDIVADTDNIIDPPASTRYSPKITTTFTNPAASAQYPFFAYRWTGDAGSDPGWTPLFYDPSFSAFALSGIVDLGVQSIDLGSGTESYRVYGLSDVAQDGGSTVTFLVD
jgi:hypothetical protein